MNLKKQSTKYGIKYAIKNITKIIPLVTWISWPLSNIILVLSFLSMALYLTQAYLLLSAFQTVAISTILAVFPIVLMVGLLPFTFGGLGLRELVAIYLLAQFGVSAPVAVIVSIMLFVFDTLIPDVLWRGDAKAIR